MQVRLKRNVARRGKHLPAGSVVDLTDREIAKLRLEGAIDDEPPAEEAKAPEPAPEPKVEAPAEEASEAQPTETTDTLPRSKPRRRRRGSK